MVVLYLWIAKLCGVKVRVCHAHMAYMTGASAKPHYRLFRVLLNRFATLRLACSKDAGDHLYGKHPYTVLKTRLRQRNTSIIRKRADTSGRKWG